MNGADKTVRKLEEGILVALENKHTANTVKGRGRVVCDLINSSMPLKDADEHTLLRHKQMRGR